jgi:DNA-binding YbaB/EbfC family protein
VSPESSTPGSLLEHALEIAQALSTQTFAGSSKDGLVSVTLSGAQEALAVKIDPKLLSSGDEEALSESVCEAFNTARADATAGAQKTIASFTNAGEA